MAYTNSPLVSYTKISPNKTANRNHDIDTISIHTMAGNCSVETCGAIFADPNRQASSQYGIGSDGRIGMYVEEKDRTWCTSNAANDHRAITIEVASTNTTDYRPSDAAYKSLINLCADICRRNNIKKLMWKADKQLIGQVDKQNMTVHRWFKAKACPGDWLYKNMGKIADDVNELLNVVTATVAEKIESEAVISAVPAVSSMQEDELFWWNGLAAGFNEYTRAGIMGNIFAESGLHSNNLQNSFEKKLGMTDEEYTKAVDDGTYTNFVHDGAGYGFCQWTWWERKQALLDYARSTNRSIGDPIMQFEFFIKELQGKNYAKLLSILASAKSVREASDAMLLLFEKPADQSEAVQKKRASYGEEYYNKYAKGLGGISVKFPYLVRVTASNLNIRKSPDSSSTKLGVIADHGVYTIMEEATGQGAKMWGRLKAGGWIALATNSKDYTEKVG